jgi:tRNA-modifying protein YgfZ
MVPELLSVVEASGACLDLSDRTKIRLTGADRVRYLNGQVTNDVRKGTAEQAVYACVTSGKGRIEADVFLHAAPADDGLLLDAEPGLREALALRLEKYLVSDDVTLEDVTDEWRLMHFFGVATATLDAWCSGLQPEIRRVKATRLGVAGVDLWIPRSATLPEGPGPVLSAEDAETLRILWGVPRWPHELNAETFPQEAGLESRAMDFAKGCYIGQEILSRIKMTGKMPRRLVQWTAREKDAGIAATGLPMPLYFEDAAGAPHEAGIMTSAAWHPLLDRWTGLGYVRQGHAHSVLLAGEGAPSICIDVKYLKA